MIQDDPRWKYGIPPANNANYAWIQHIISKLFPTGVAGFVLANGSMSTSTRAEAEIRKKSLKRGWWTVLSPCRPTFLQRHHTGLPVVPVQEKREPQRKDSLYRCPQDGNHGDQKAPGAFRRGDRQNLRHLPQLAGWQGRIPGRRASANPRLWEEVRGHEYILTPGRYVGIEEAQDDGEPFDEKMARLTGELAEMFARSHKLEEEIKQRLGAIGYEF